VAHVVDGVAHALLRHELLALLEHDLALVVHDVVVFQDVLADVEVARLDLRLAPLDRLVDPGWTMASSSFSPSFGSIPSMRSEPKMRIRSSWSDR
jgi:hypothetical protein